MSNFDIICKQNFGQNFFLYIFKYTFFCILATDSVLYSGVIFSADVFKYYMKAEWPTTYWDQREIEEECSQSQSLFHKTEKCRE